MAKGALFLAVVGALFLVAFSRPLQPKAAYDIVGVSDSGSYSGGHAGRRLDQHAGDYSPEWISVVSFAEAEQVSSRDEFAPPGKVDKSSARAAGAAQLLGPGLAGTESTAGVNEAKTPSGTERSSFATSKALAESRG